MIDHALLSYSDSDSGENIFFSFLKRRNIVHEFVNFFTFVISDSWIDKIKLS